ncbi:MAG: hypothetical protein OPY06_05290, partial [Nitrosopumilus sp.]|nr:hypothetical protein [Nitrosopumilus sp.]
MKFRKFFKDKDSLNVSILSEKRHYMKHSVIPGDTFPVPVSVMNVLNMISPHLHGQVFAWILGEGLRRASVNRRNFAKSVSKWLSEQYGKEINIPQEALFSRQAQEQIPELGQNIDKIETAWIRIHEPNSIDFPRSGSGNVRMMTSVPLAQINALLIRQGKTPLYFGGQDGLIEYIEGGSWRDHPIGDPEITHYGKDGISLALDPGNDGYKVTKKGEHIISLGEDPTYGKDYNDRQSLTDEDVREKLLDDWKPTSKETEGGDPQITLSKPGQDDIVLIKKGDKWHPPKTAVHPGSYIAPQYSNKTGANYWNKKLEISRKESNSTVKRIFDSIQRGESVENLDDESLDYLAQLVNDGQISRESFQSRDMTMKDLAKIMSKGAGMWQKAGGDENDFVKYKAAVKAGLINSLKSQSKNEKDGANWGDDPSGRWPRVRLSVSGKRGVIDLNTDKTWIGRSIDDPVVAEEIADALIS